MLPSSPRSLRAALAGLVLLPVVTGCGITGSSSDESGPALLVYSALSFGA